MKVDCLIVYFSLIMCTIVLFVESHCKLHDLVLGCCALGGGSASFILKSNNNSSKGNSVRIKTASTPLLYSI